MTTIFCLVLDWKGRLLIPRLMLTRPSRQISSMRATQPTFNLFTGGEAASSQQQRPSSRQSNNGGGLQRGVSASCESTKENVAPADAEEYESQRRRIEELRAEVASLKYLLHTHDQERDLLRLQHESDLGDAQRRAEEDFRARQAAEAERARFARQVDQAAAELAEVRSGSAAEKGAAEKKARDAAERARRLEERCEDVEAEKEEAARAAARELLDARDEAEARRREVEELEQAVREQAAVSDGLRRQLQTKDEALAAREAEVLRLRAQTGDAETMAIIKRELADQVAHIRALETQAREHVAELKLLRSTHRAVEVVEEEKRSLRRRVDEMEALEKELLEARIQRQRLEDERIEWTSYLASAARARAGEKGTGGADDKDAPPELQFASPADVARALVAERLESARLLDRLGTLQPAVTERDAIIAALEADKAALQLRWSKSAAGATGGAAAGAAAASDARARARLERQRDLAMREAEYLRAQLRSFDSEDAALSPDELETERAGRIRALEDLVDGYKGEVKELHIQLAARDGAMEPQAPAAIPGLGGVAGKKRAADAAEDAASAPAVSSQFGQLSRKNRLLQDELAALQAAHALVRAELDAAKGQLSAFQAAAKLRVLSLRANPTADHEAVKQATIDELRRAYNELLAVVDRRTGPAPVDLVPLATLAVARREAEAARAETASAQKSARRLKEVWAAKSAEFKAAVDSMLGWNVAFLPNGRMRVESVFYPSANEAGDEHENSIVFDGEQGTMKVAGGPKSRFAERIQEQIQFWVRDKGCIPGFLAALTLEFYEEQMRNGGGG